MKRRTLGQKPIEEEMNRGRTLIPGWVYLDRPLTSTSWDGDGFSTTAKTTIDLSSVFGAPAKIKAVDVKLSARDSGSAGGTAWIIISPNATAGQGRGVNLAGHDSDSFIENDFVCPCDSAGDIYYQCTATGASTLDVVLEIWGYYL